MDTFSKSFRDTDKPKCTIVEVLIKFHCFSQRIQSSKTVSDEAENSLNIFRI